MNYTSGILTKKYNIFLRSFFLIFVTYSLFCNQNYNADCISAYGKPVATFYNIPLDSFHPLVALIYGLYLGRPVLVFTHYMIEFIARLCGITQTHGQFVFVLIAMLLLAYTGTEIYYLFLDELKLDDDVIVFCCIMLGIISPAIAEVLSFTLVEIFLGLIFTVKALKAFLRNHRIACWLWLFLAIATYQSYYAPFLIYVFFLLYLRNDGVPHKKWLSEAAIAICIAGTASIVLLLSAKISAVLLGVPAKIPLSSVLGTNIIYRLAEVLLRYGLILLTSGGVFPFGFTLACIAFFLPALVIKQYKHAGWKGVFLLLILGLSALVVPPAFALMMRSIYIPPRALIAFYVAVGLYFLLCYKALFLPQKKEENASRSAHVAGLMFGLFLYGYTLFSIFSLNTAGSNVLSANTLERHIAREIQQEIQDYEETSGNTIRRIGVAHYRIPGQQRFDDANFRHFWKYNYFMHLLMYTTWSDVASLNYFNNTDYERFDMTSAEKHAFFSDLDIEKMGTFNPDTQLVFVGDTLYWATY